MISQDEKNVRLSNRWAEIVLSDSGRTLSFTDRLHGAELLASPEEPFCFLISENGEKIFPDNLSLSGGELAFGFGGEVLRLLADVSDEFFVFTVTEEPGDSWHSLRFADMRFGYDFDSGKTITVGGYAMNITVNPMYYPGGAAKACGGECFRAIGAKGSKLAVIAAPYEEQREIIKKINALIPKGDLPITASGGANAPDFTGNRGDYVIISDSDPAKVPEWIEFYTRWSVDQLDFHQGSNTFRQGDFKFHLTGDAAGFREKVAGPLGKAGITCGLHTYSATVDYNAEGILSEPRWQKDLESVYEFTLAEDITADDVSVRAVESTDNVSPEQGWSAYNSPFLLIGSEIIKYEFRDGVFSVIRRGWAGTVPAPHKAGTVFRVISGYYGMLLPKLGSELFLHLARETAKTYNAGGFGMIYLDALDAIGVQASHNGIPELSWYYHALFVNEVTKYLERTPVMEYSATPPSIWAGRGRGLAWDTGSRAYKRFVKKHIDDNRCVTDAFYNGNLGWFNFYPTDDSKPGGFGVKYMFSDDVDYAGAMALAHSHSNTYNGLVESAFDGCPALKRNMELYLRYNRLRKSGAVPDSVLEELRKGKHEWKLTGADNAPRFTEAEYLRSKLYALTDGRGRFRSSNPFGDQEPFIRIENHMTSDGSDPVTLIDLDPGMPLKGQRLSAELDHYDLSDRLALKVKVFGNGSGDAVCIRLSGYDLINRGVYDYVVRLDFEGWREFILAENDNGEYGDIVFPGKRDGLYEYYRETLNLKNVTKAEIFLSGDCEGVRMSPVEAVRHRLLPLTDPAVRVGEQKIRFGCAVEATEYLEYTPGKGALIYDRYGNTRPAETTAGKIILPRGEFEAELSASAAAAAVPSRATLTFGVYGDTIG